MLTRSQAAELCSTSYSGALLEQATLELSSAPIVALALCMPQAVQPGGAVRALLELLGPDDASVAKAVAPRSVRAAYGLDAVSNAAHASPDADAAARELRLFFPRVLARESTALLVLGTASAFASEALAEASARGLLTIASTSRQLGRDEATSLAARLRHPPGVDALIDGPVFAAILDGHGGLAALHELVGQPAPTEGAACPLLSGGVGMLAATTHDEAASIVEATFGHEPRPEPSRRPDPDPSPDTAWP